MTDEIWKRAEVDSPCVKVCVIHPEARLCVGCYRSMDEIGAWSRMTAEARRAVMADLPSRAPRLVKRRGGRAGRLEG
ncbi:DUF1289 domain-containing protein [Gemmobacter lutimaris]|uniref:DUF1289 domain-containing protein n=1 Tax=Gemmobacter lutimaris TaxID=2306023 RepID=A0A398BRH0_9RHOB|nr:DUF1289 domain-containing protein [Gemmobacter lutimaris]RID91501.1 DUF1289 domain-containing protein [Gemmobacter lutimaris]